MNEAQNLINFYDKQMKDMLKAENTKLKEHLKRTHQIMTEMNEEIAKLKQEKKELIEWLEEENEKSYEIYIDKVLERLGE